MPLHRMLVIALAFAALVTSGAALAHAEETPFKIEPLFTQNCARCHNINGINGVCPDLSTIGARRDEAYIRESIMEPNAYIVPGFPKDIMPKFSLILKPEEVDQLVKFLLTLKGQTIDHDRVSKGVKW